MAESIRAVVQKIIRDGKHGPFAVAKADNFNGSITFSLEPTVWLEKEYPARGEVVLLGKFIKKRAGWRAKTGRLWQLSDEQKAIRKEQIMKNVDDFLEKLEKRWFSGNELWKKWVDLKYNNYSDLHELIKSDVRLEFKERAIFILLVPLPEWNPLYCKNEAGCFFLEQSFFKDLPSRLVPFTADLICNFYGALKKIHEQGSFSEADRHDINSALHCYNNSIIWLLPRLLEKEAERMFELFEINDPMPFYNESEQSGYTPLEELFDSCAIDKKWKEKADVQMREIIKKEELAGVKKPREEWESAIDCYCRIIISQLGDGMFNHPLLPEQVKFIFINAKSNKYSPLRPHRIYDFFQLLYGDRHKKLWYGIVKYLILQHDEKFIIYNQNDLMVARMALKEFGEVNKELKEALQIAIEKGKKQIQENRKIKKSQQSFEENILDQMS